MSSYETDPQPNKKISKAEQKRRKLEKRRFKKKVRRAYKDFVRSEYKIYNQVMSDINNIHNNELVL